ncbi:MAG: serine/threonine-protein kinase [Thermoanaerobaculia bacterium]
MASPVYGAGQSPDGRPFYVMKRVEGRTLRALLDERGRRVTDLLWRQRLLAIFADICETVAYAHARGVVHRDLKPDNVLVDEHDSVTVIDWGLAKRAEASRTSSARTVLGDVLGSPGYMAPEQASGDSLAAGPPADVFSLGAILYEILTGSNPFPGATARESMLAAIHRDPPDLAKSVRGLPFSRSLASPSAARHWRRSRGIGTRPPPGWPPTCARCAAAAPLRRRPRRSSNGCAGRRNGARSPSASRPLSAPPCFRACSSSSARRGSNGSSPPGRSSGSSVATSRSKP